MEPRQIENWMPTYIWRDLGVPSSWAQRLTDIALRNDPFARQAKNTIGSHIRGLIGNFLSRRSRQPSPISCRVMVFWPRR